MPRGIWARAVWAAIRPTTERRNMTKAMTLASAMTLATIGSISAAEWRCYGNTSRCGWVYSEQELDQMRQNRAVRELDYSSRGGTRRASDVLVRPRSKPV